MNLFRSHAIATFITASMTLSSFLTASPSMRSQKVSTPFNDVTCSCQWLTQKETKKLMQSENFAKFMHTSKDLEDSLSGVVTIAMILASVAIVANDIQNNNHHHVTIVPDVHITSPIHASADAQLPILNDLTNITVENLHQHITPIKVHVENNSGQTLFIPKTEYLSALQSQSVSLDNLLNIFPKIDKEKSPLRWTCGISSVISLLTLCGALGTGYLCGEKFNTKCGWSIFYGFIAAGFSCISAYLAKNGYDCWNALDTLNALKKHHKNLTDNITIVYDSATGQEVTPDEFSFGYAIPPHAVFESLLFVKTDKCETYLLDTVHQGAMTLNAKQVDMRSLFADSVKSIH